MVPVTDVDRAEEFYERVGLVTGRGLTEMRPGCLDASEVEEPAWGRFVAFADGNRWTLQQLPDWSTATATATGS